MNPSYKTIQKRYSYSARGKSDYGESGIVKKHEIKMAKEYSNKAKREALEKAKGKESWAESHGQKEGAKMHKGTITGRYF